MTTDNKAVARWGGLTIDPAMVLAENGTYVLFTDHERVVGEAWARTGEAQLQRDQFWQEAAELRTALAASRAEVDGLRRDADRMDFIERTFAAVTTQERYLPLQMIWGNGANGRTLRQAADKYMAQSAAQGE